MPDVLDEAPPAEAQPDETAPPDYGEDFKDLPKQLVDAIRAAICDRQGEEKFTRRREILRDRKNRFYEYGYQHLTWNQTGFALATPGGLITNSLGQSQQCPSYIDDYNIYARYLLIIMSVLTQNQPGVVFQPIDPQIPEDNDKAKEAEGYAKAYDRMNDPKSLMKQQVRMMGNSGRCVSWTRTETDGQRFGYNDDGTPKTFQRTSILGTLETKCQVLCREFDKNFPYLFIYDDPDVKVAKDEYPDFAEEIKPGEQALNENTYERTARLGVLSGSRSRAQLGDSLTHLTSRINAFLRPSNFTGGIYDTPYTEDDAQGETIKEKLAKVFAVGRDKKFEGIRAVFVGQTYVASYAESMDDHIDICFPYEGDGFFRQAFMDPLTVVQDGFNDLMNWIREKIDTGAGSLWVRGSTEDVAAITSQRAAPNAVRPAKNFATPDRPLADGFYKEEDPQIPATLMEFLQLLKGELPEFLVAALPALQGSEMSENKTASGYAQATVQAKGQLGIIWASMQRQWARIRYQSALCAAKCDQMQGQISVPGGKNQPNIQLDMDKLRKGDFGCYPDEDSSFPESTQQKRATFQNLITMAGQSEQLQQLLDNPDNVAIAKSMLGFEELVFLPAEARNKQLHEIEQLLGEEPLGWISDPMQLAEETQVHQVGVQLAGAQQMQPPPAPNSPQTLQPSIPIGELDYDQWEGAKGQEWMSSAARRQEDARGNQAGVMNVQVHTMAHLARAAAKAAAAAMQQAQMAPPNHHGTPSQPKAPGVPSAPGNPQAIQ